VGIAFLVLFFLIRKIRASTLIAVFKTIQWEYFIPSVLLLIPNILVQALKWHYLLKLSRPSISCYRAFASLLAGYPLGFATPGRLGEIGRALLVKEIHKNTTLRLVILDKISNALVTILFGLVGLGWLTQEYLLLNLQPLVKLSLFLLMGSLILLFVFPTILRKIAGRTKMFSFGRKQFSLVLLGAIGFYAVFLTQFLLLILSFGAANPISAAGAAADVFLFKTILPISIADLGIREGASIFFLKTIGVSAASAFNASLLLFLINLGLPTLVGLWFLLKK
jgi:uncharacterized membrane protein YbhN (UPF0104 family)